MRAKTWQEHFFAGDLEPKYFTNETNWINFHIDRGAVSLYESQREMRRYMRSVSYRRVI